MQAVTNRRVPEAVYQPNRDPPSITIWSSRLPGAVVCLLSSLRFHGIGTQLPPEVWLAVPRGARVPRLHTPPIRVVSLSPGMFDLGVEKHRIEGPGCQGV